MNILICHERFLFRFGADRVLILLGKGLQEQGHSVTIMANRYDADIVNSFSSRVIDCPIEGAAYLDLSEFTADWLRSRWNSLFTAENRPDIIIVGGWPFFSAITVFREFCQHVLFIDFGVVPTYGYPDGVKITLDKLRALRKRHLPDASLIVGISRFIADSQSRLDAGESTPVTSVLLGADHMEMTVWPAAQLKLSALTGSALNLVQSLKLQGKKVILCLGRWEPGCYKNSQAALDVIAQITAAHPAAISLILDEPSNVQVPASQRDSVLAIGFPDDQELIQIMHQADLGISLSLWEGFNLPLAEMQWFGKPALVFDAGAHPEVVAHPWYLCRDASEMAAKAIEILDGTGPASATITGSLEKFRSYFRWERFMSDYSTILRALKTPGAARRSLLIDVTNSTRDTANSGVVRVTRRLGRELQRSGEDPIFVVWDQSNGNYVLPTQAEYGLLSQFNGPVHGNDDRLSASFEQRTSVDKPLVDSVGWLLLPELVMESSFQRIRQFARERNLNIVAIFYDAIPLLRPDMCNKEVRDNHRHYMLGLAECDLALPISNFSANCLRDFWRDAGITPSCRIVPDVLPGEFGGALRETLAPSSRTDGVRILCVSTLEPRKNHRNLIQACLWISQNFPALDWSLKLVGNRYSGAFEIADWIQEVSAANPRIQWLGVVDDATLDRLYREASFTVYPSVIEGFGLPILESIWHGRPCVCYNQGVMAELAEDGGCLTADVTDPVQLAEAIHQLATDKDLRTRLSREAAARPLKSWRNYAVDLLDALAAQPSKRALTSRKLPVAAATNGHVARSWQATLYADCLVDNWQMNDSERMALAGLLARQQPYCSIEVGTYCGGSLSLISQFSKMVFSIDIDDTIPSRFQFPNVSFLTGPSTVILPHLLRELDKAGTPVDFILIDGDHSESGVMGDIACLLAYIPKNPFFVLLHDSFNPECRRGMLNAGWEKSPYCHWVDIDFVPGRIVEHHGPSRGELWGGLAAAYFLPVIRSGDLHIARTAEQMFQRLSAPSFGREGVHS